MDSKRFQNFIDRAGEVLLDKEQELKLALSCLLARGHLLIEDIPGVGKTTMVHLLARLLQLDFSRIQFTNDLLPADILGSSIFNPAQQKFSFHPGPIFGQLILGDELNRATPKTQSAFLQAMEEQQITVDGITHPLPKPFFLIATQNPRQQIGTFPLPESQLDRFMMRIELGYPGREAERRLLQESSRAVLLESVESLFSPADILRMQAEVEKIHLSDPIVRYIQDILEASRSGAFITGLSPRAGLAVARAARAWAYVEGRQMVIPDDVQAVASHVISHRLNHRDGVLGDSPRSQAEQLVKSVRVD